MKISPIKSLILVLFCLTLPACQRSKAEQQHEEHHAEHHKIVVTSPEKRDVVVTEPYVCQIHSRRHIEVRALERGYLEKILVKEGQAVKKGDLMFKLVPTLYEAKLDSEKAEAQLAQIEFENTRKLFEQRVVSDREVALAKAKLAKASANVELAQAELNFTDIRAPFDGIIDRLHEQLGSLIEEGDILTTLSDNSVMWVYFNVPESRYLEYKADLKRDRQAKVEKDKDDDDDDDRDDDDDEQDDDADKTEQEKDLKVELVLANADKFHQPGVIGAIEADFNNETGNIAFRADFPNPQSLLRHGQTGSVLMSRVVKGAVVIPQRATFETLDKRYAYVVGEDGVIHQRDIVIGDTLDDIFLIKKGLNPNDRIVLEGIGEVHDGEKVEYEFIAPKEVLDQLKYKAE
jgi:membrane fusion protein, multidrug efflux system